MKFKFPGKVKSFEILSDKSYTILTKQGDLNTENWTTNIKNDFQFPIIRRFDKSTILIAECRARKMKIMQKYSTEMVSS